MKSSSRYRITLQLICYGLLFNAPVFVSRTGAQESDHFPDGPGKNTFLRTCSSCHTPDNVIGSPRDANAWYYLVDRMIQYGATGNEDDFEAILNYLATNFGPPPDKINVNTVTVANLYDWLFFTQKQAEDFVAYRKKHGRFKSLDDLKKVPGINLKIIDEKKKILTF